MRRFVFSPFIRSVSTAALCAGALALAACSNPVAQGIGNAGSGLAERLSLSRGSTNREPVPQRTRPDDRPCPRAVIRDGTQTLRVYERGGEGDPQFIRYQGSILKIARECTYSGDEIVSVKFGVSGRVVIGPRGAPGTYSVPIRAVFMPRGGKPAWSELFNQSVTIPEGDTSADFVMVQQTPAISIEPGRTVSDYTVFVGFDEKAGG